MGRSDSRPTEIHFPDGTGSDTTAGDAATELGVGAFRGVRSAARAAKQMKENRMAIYPVSDSCESPDPEDHRKAMRAMMGPHAVQSQIEQAISTCWMMLPDERKNPDGIAVEIRRIVERALNNLKEDAEAFGMSSDDP